ncbi:MAG: threonine--tRNA ligase, partial [Anaerolineae bacterium]|nr:threonine--tRNA ligase [Anaerolineae bacterium]
MNALLARADAYIPPGYDPALYKIRHSAAHIMAQAVKERFAPDGDVHIAIGPPIDSGFYYDFELPRPINDDDLVWIEARMRAIIAEDHPFSVRQVSADEARAIFHDELFKLELIDGLEAGGVDENGQPLPADQRPPITLYQQDSFVDLCRGPHVPSTGALDPAAIRLLSTSGAYWRGDEHQPMLQRIYGTAFATPAELEHFLWQRAEAEKRDHRKLGRELELFHLDPTAPGMPYWLPKGMKLLNELLAFWREIHEAHGYQEISAPLINEKSLWETSGHWDHYKDEMFLMPVDEHTTYGVKPMNCPNAMVVFNLKTRSYRDLPLRLSDVDTLHRHERSGTLHGLLRVQRFQQDDAHLFVTEDQIEAEYNRVFELADLFYNIFGLDYTLRLGTRPEDFVGEIEVWDKAEAYLRRILENQGRPYTVLDGDGAFYGPKVDILMHDALGREWQMGTIQLDFQLPQRFNCLYTDSDGQRKHPVVIHRVIYGSLERFIGILIEHTAGAFPVWIAPVQAVVLPVADAHLDYACQVAEQLRAAHIRVEVDDRSERVSAKIRDAQLQKIPYMLVVGGREVEQGA